MFSSVLYYHIIFIKNAERLGKGIARLAWNGKLTIFIEYKSASPELLDVNSNVIVVITLGQLPCPMWLLKAK